MYMKNAAACKVHVQHHTFNGLEKIAVQFTLSQPFASMYALIYRFYRWRKNLNQKSFPPKKI